MKIFQTKWTSQSGWEPSLPVDKAVNLVLVFGSTTLLKEALELPKLKAAYPQAVFFGCSTAGEIVGTKVSDESLAVTAVQFEKTVLRPVYADVQRSEESFQAGETLAR